MRFCSAEVFFLLSMLVWNENSGAFGQGKHTECSFSLIVDFPSRCSNVVVLKFSPLVVKNRNIPV